MLTPAGVLLVWFRGIVAIAIVAGAVWLIYRWVDEARPPVRHDVTPPISTTEEAPRRELTAWRPGWDRPTFLLAGGISLILLGVGGRSISPRLFRPNGPDVPQLTGGREVTIDRPDGTKLHVEIYGESGPTIVATHGWGTDRREWGHLGTLANAGLRIVVWDLPGMGLSGRPSNNDYSLDKFAHDLWAVIDKCTDGPIVLMGHSIGGMTILTFCRHFPELLGQKVAGLILMHTSYRNPVRTMLCGGLLSAIEKPIIIPLLYLQIALSPFIWISNCLSYFNGSIHWSNKMTGFGGTESRQELDFVSQYTLTTSPAVLARGCLGMLQYDARDVLARINVPVLVFSGDKDPVTLPSANSNIAERAPSGTLRTLSPAKHYGFLEHHDSFLVETVEMCERVTAPIPIAAVH